MSSIQNTISDVSAPLVLVPQYFGSTVFDRRTSRYMPFDAEATALLVKLANTPFDLLIEETEDSAEQDTLFRFFEHHQSLGFFTQDLRFHGDVLDIEPPADHMTGPLAVHLEVIAACNLKCSHCFAGELPRRADLLTMSELDTLFRSMAKMGSYRLGLTGGEPLLRRDIFEVIDLATSHGLHPCITTNALLITEDIAREFARRDLVWLNVSLEGATPATNDAVRGSGTFDRVMDKLAILSRHSRFTLAFTIMKTNVDEVAACVELARKMGAHTAVFRPLYPVGTAQSHLDLMPTFDEYNDALNTLSGIENDASFKLRGIDPFGPHTRRETQSSTYTNGGCGAGNLVCSISASGDVSPCSFLGAGMIDANVRDLPLETIWHRGHRFQEMRAIPEHEDGVGFDGGCRARALILAGSVNAPDPWIMSRAERDAQVNGRRFYHPLTVIDRGMAR